MPEADNDKTALAVPAATRCHNHMMRRMLLYMLYNAGCYTSYTCFCCISLYVASICRIEIACLQGIWFTERAYLPGRSWLLPSTAAVLPPLLLCRPQRCCCCCCCCRQVSAAVAATLAVRNMVPAHRPAMNTQQINKSCAMGIMCAGHAASDKLVCVKCA
jgi:hypothetical protein